MGARPAWATQKKLLKNEQMIDREPGRFKSRTLTKTRHLKKFALIVCVILYVMAGVNHFWHPVFYLHIIPPYLPFPKAINYISGLLELLLGVLLIFKSTRFTSAIGIIVLLILFIPAHIYTIQIACPPGTTCNMQWVALIRLIIIQPLLIAWAWWIKD